MSNTHLAAEVGAAPVPFLPSNDAKCCSSASSRLAGACAYIGSIYIYVIIIISSTIRKTNFCAKQQLL